MKAVAVALLAASVAATFAEDGFCGSACIAARTPSHADIQGSLTVPESFSAGGVIVSGVKGEQAFSADSAHVSKHLKTSLLDSDLVQTEVLSANIIQSPTGQLILEGIASISGAVHYATPGASFLEVAEDAQVHPARPWTLVSDESFDEGTGGAWTGAGGAAARTSHCGDSNHFLGGHCVASHHLYSRTLEKLPPHRELRVRARFHFIDQWQGESAFAKVDDEVVWVDSHTTRGGARGISMCGHDDHAEQRMGVPVDVIIPHDAASATLSLGAVLDRDACTVSWGADDIEVFVR